MSTMPSLCDRAYQHILRKLTSGQLVAGSLISEPSLAEELGMSRTPVREAIKRLEHEGLVDQVPRYGTVVRQPGRRELAELFEMREAMECHAMALAAEAIGAADLKLLHRLVDEMQRVADALTDGGHQALEGAALRRFLAADMAFHTVLLRAAGNQRMMKAVAEWRVFMRIFSTPRQTHDLRVVRSTLSYHRRILEAVEHQRPDPACALMREHIRVSREEALACFDTHRAGRPSDERLVLALPEDLADELDLFPLGEAGDGEN